MCSSDLVKMFGDETDDLEQIERVEAVSDEVNPQIGAYLAQIGRASCRERV